MPNWLWLPVGILAFGIFRALAEWLILGRRDR
jgi:hypothetical protein